MQLEPSSVSLVELLEAGLALVRERAARQEVTVALRVGEGVGLVWGDAVKLKQVVVNLFTNAVKYTPSGGSVQVSAWLEGEEVVVLVKDTGIGIAVEDQTRIFEAFQRGDRRASVEGTGLGLTLSKRFVELHGGRIWVDSVLGSGSTFGFAIPVGVP
jgi:signal transduction histidine kinase